MPPAVYASLAPAAVFPPSSPISLTALPPVAFSVSALRRLYPTLSLEVVACEAARARADVLRAAAARAGGSAGSGGHAGSAEQQARMVERAMALLQAQVDRQRAPGNGSASARSRVGSASNSPRNSWSRTSSPSQSRPQSRHETRRPHGLASSAHSPVAAAAAGPLRSSNSTRTPLYLKSSPHSGGAAGPVGAWATPAATDGFTRWPEGGGGESASASASPAAVSTKAPSHLPSPPPMPMSAPSSSSESGGRSARLASSLAFSPRTHDAGANEAEANEPHSSSSFVARPPTQSPHYPPISPRHAHPSHPGTARSPLPPGVSPAASRRASLRAAAALLRGGHPAPTAAAMHVLPGGSVYAQPSRNKRGSMTKQGNKSKRSSMQGGIIVASAAAAAPASYIPLKPVSSAFGSTGLFDAPMVRSPPLQHRASDMVGGGGSGSGGGSGGSDSSTRHLILHLPRPSTSASIVFGVSSQPALWKEARSLLEYFRSPLRSPFLRGAPDAPSRGTCGWDAPPGGAPLVHAWDARDMVWLCSYTGLRSVDAVQSAIERLEAFESQQEPLRQPGTPGFLSSLHALARALRLMAAFPLQHASTPFPNASPSSPPAPPPLPPTWSGFSSFIAASAVHTLDPYLVYVYRSYTSVCEMEWGTVTTTTVSSAKEKKKKGKKKKDKRERGFDEPDAAYDLSGSPRSPSPSKKAASATPSSSPHKKKSKTTKSPSKVAVASMRGLLDTDSEFATASASEEEAAVDASTSAAATPAPFVTPIPRPSVRDVVALLEDVCFARPCTLDPVAEELPFAHAAHLLRPRFRDVAKVLQQWAEQTKGQAIGNGNGSGTGSGKDQGAYTGPRRCFDSLASLAQALRAHFLHRASVAAREQQLAPASSSDSSNAASLTMTMPLPATRLSFLSHKGPIHGAVESGVAAAAAAAASEEVMTVAEQREVLLQAKQEAIRNMRATLVELGEPLSDVENEAHSGTALVPLHSATPVSSPTSSSSSSASLRPLFAHERSLLLSLHLALDSHAARARLSEALVFSGFVTSASEAELAAAQLEAQSRRRPGGGVHRALWLLRVHLAGGGSAGSTTANTWPELLAAMEEAHEHFAAQLDILAQMLSPHSHTQLLRRLFPPASAPAPAPSVATASAASVASPTPSPPPAATRTVFAPLVGLSLSEVEMLLLQCSKEDAPASEIGGMDGGVDRWGTSGASSSSPSGTMKSYVSPEQVIGYLQSLSAVGRSFAPLEPQQGFGHGSGSSAMLWSCIHAVRSLHAGHLARERLAGQTARLRLAVEQWLQPPDGEKTCVLFSSPMPATAAGDLLELLLYGDASVIPSSEDEDGAAAASPCASEDALMEELVVHLLYLSRTRQTVASHTELCTLLATLRAHRASVEQDIVRWLFLHAPGWVSDEGEPGGVSLFSAHVLARTLYLRSLAGPQCVDALERVQLTRSELFEGARDGPLRAATPAASLARGSPLQLLSHPSRRVLKLLRMQAADESVLQRCDLEEVLQALEGVHAGEHAAVTSTDPLFAEAVALLQGSDGNSSTSVFFPRRAPFSLEELRAFWTEVITSVSPRQVVPLLHSLAAALQGLTSGERVHGSVPLGMDGIRRFRSQHRLQQHHPRRSMSSLQELALAVVTLHELETKSIALQSKQRRRGGSSQSTQMNKAIVRQEHTTTTMTSSPPAAAVLADPTAAPAASADAVAQLQSYFASPSTHLFPGVSLTPALLDQILALHGGDAWRTLRVLRALEQQHRARGGTTRIDSAPVLLTRLFQYRPLLVTRVHEFLADPSQGGRLVSRQDMLERESPERALIKSPHPEDEEQSDGAVGTTALPYATVATWLATSTVPPALVLYYLYLLLASVPPANAAPHALFGSLADLRTGVHALHSLGVARSVLSECVLQDPVTVEFDAGTGEERLVEAGTFGGEEVEAMRTVMADNADALFGTLQHEEGESGDATVRAVRDEVDRSETIMQLLQASHSYEAALYAVQSFLDQPNDSAHVANRAFVSARHLRSYLEGHRRSELLLKRRVFQHLVASSRTLLLGATAAAATMRPEVLAEIAHDDDGMPRILAAPPAESAEQQVAGQHDWHALDALYAVSEGPGPSGLHLGAGPDALRGLLFLAERAERPFATVEEAVRAVEQWSHERRDQEAAATAAAHSTPRGKKVALVMTPQLHRVLHQLTVKSCMLWRHVVAHAASGGFQAQSNSDSSPAAVRWSRAQGRWSGVPINFLTVQQLLRDTHLSLECEPQDPPEDAKELGGRLGLALRHVGERQAHPAATGLEEVIGWLNALDQSLLALPAAPAPDPAPVGADENSNPASAIPEILPQFRALVSSLGVELEDRRRAHLHDLVAQCTVLREALREGEFKWSSRAAAELSSVDEMYAQAREVSTQHTQAKVEELQAEAANLYSNSWVSQEVESAAAAAAATSQSDESVISPPLSPSDPRVVREDETLLHLLQAQLSAAHEHLSLVHASESLKFQDALQHWRRRVSKRKSMDRGVNNSLPLLSYPYHEALESTLARDTASIQAGLVAGFARDSNALNQSVTSQRADLSSDASMQRRAEEMCRLPVSRFRALLASQAQRACSVVLRLRADFRREQAMHENAHLELANGNSIGGIGGEARDSHAPLPRERRPCTVRADGDIERCPLTFLPRLYCTRLVSFASDARQLVDSSLAEAKQEVAEALSVLRAERLAAMSPQHRAESERAARKIQASFRLHRSRKTLDAAAIKAATSLAVPGAKTSEPNAQQAGPQGSPRPTRPPRTGSARPNHGPAAHPVLVKFLTAKGCNLLEEKVLQQLSTADTNALLAACSVANATTSDSDVPAASASAEAATGEAAPARAVNEAQTLQLCLQYLRQLRVQDQPPHAAVADLVARILRVRASDVQMEHALQRYIARSMLLPRGRPLSAAGLIRLRELVPQMSVAFRVVKVVQVYARLGRADSAPSDTALFESEEALLAVVAEHKNDSLAMISDALNPHFQSNSLSTSPTSRDGPQTKVLEGLWLAGHGCARCILQQYLPAVFASSSAAAAAAAAGASAQGGGEGADGQPRLTVLELSIQTSAFAASMRHSMASIASVLARWRMLPAAPAQDGRYALEHIIPATGAVHAWEACELPDASPHAHAALHASRKDPKDASTAFPIASAPTLDALVRYDAKLHRFKGQAGLPDSMVALLQQFLEKTLQERAEEVPEDASVFEDEGALLAAVQRAMQALMAPQNQEAAPALPAAAALVAPVPSPTAASLAPPASSSPAAVAASRDSAMVPPGSPSPPLHSPSPTPSALRRGGARRDARDRMSIRFKEDGDEGKEKEKESSRSKEKKEGMRKEEKKQAASSSSKQPRPSAEAAARAAAAEALDAAIASSPLHLRLLMAAEREEAAIRIQALQRGRAARQEAAVRRAVRARQEADRREAEAAETRRSLRRKTRRRSVTNEGVANTAVAAEKAAPALHADRAVTAPVLVTDVGLEADLLRQASLADEALGAAAALVASLSSSGVGSTGVLPAPLSVAQWAAPVEADLEMEVAVETAHEQA